MGLFRQLTTERRIGIVGLFASGKTTLITSLVNHLADHDPDRFRLGNGREPVTLRKFREIDASRGWERFPYAAHRDALVSRGRWPSKTRDRSEFACQFERSDWAFSDCLLRLTDLPGERLADAGMLGRGYAEWSDAWHAQAHADAASRSAAAGFFARLGDADAPADQLLGGFRLALATAISPPYYKPAVSPSTFLLDVNGQLARGDTPEAVMAGRFAGLGAASEFCPLPAALRQKRPDLVEAFAHAYDLYNVEVVMPTLAAFRSCHGLIICIDVLHLLAAGVAACNDARALLRDLFTALEPGESIFNRVGRNIVELFPTEYLPVSLAAISRVAFVVPKIDLVHPRDRDRLMHLAKRFVGKLAEDCDHLRSESFNVAAIRSTRPLAADDPERVLIGVLNRDRDGRKLPPGPEQRFVPSTPPAEWPATWAAGDFRFPEVYPSVPALHTYPPDQFGLDRVLDFVTQ